jgi:hypothetical protein
MLVPEVYRFFQNQDFPEYDQQDVVGYLVMEFVSGRPLSDLWQTEAISSIKKVAEAVKCMSLIHCDQPGLVDGGEPRGLIWAPDNRAYEQFHSTDNLEAWFDRALVMEEATIDLHRYRLSLCHLDLNRRNILLVEDNTICLLD